MSYRHNFLVFFFRGGGGEGAKSTDTDYSSFANSVDPDKKTF